MDTRSADSGVSDTLTRSARQRCCEACGKHTSGGAAEAKLARTSNDARRASKAPVSSPGSDGKLRVVLQVRSKNSQVREEACRTACRASENSRIYAKHSLAIERLARQGKSLSSIAKTVHCVKWRQSY